MYTVQLERLTLPALVFLYLCEMKPMQTLNLGKISLLQYNEKNVVEKGFLILSKKQQV